MTVLGLEIKKNEHLLMYMQMYIPINPLPSRTVFLVKHLFYTQPVLGFISIQKF